MPQVKRPEYKLRFDTPGQTERIRKAAKLKHWSFNRFVIEAAKEAADQTLMANKNGQKQLIAESSPLTLNQ